ncbi:recombinase RmuC [Sulfoacidibacillus thermotolerans]|uniref:Recombinase RmuC n=2 Tax=Sulfoacidibacillus thermotolerans TaxID=1765684 RepID=A0A2U3DCJ4_SULT2|nr:recombinase RmuC [Sulfoacidibacillus thermotolerans]
MRDEFPRNRTEMLESARRDREEIGRILERHDKALHDAVQRQSISLQKNLEGITQILGKASQEQRMELAHRLDHVTEVTEARLHTVKETLEQRLHLLLLNNEQKLEQMRLTVDEKLHATLEQRLGDSFKLVSERLEQVHKGLGEMQTLAGGVGDLKRIMTNVKTRGTWGEVQLGTLLQQILTVDQYATNVAVHPEHQDRVEFALRLPGKRSDESPVWLPIDAKFPIEDYQRLMDAQDVGDLGQMEEAGKALERRVREEAKKIREKYVCPPYTTDFAILFVPTEGLYAEIIRRPGLLEELQSTARVVVAGPTTIAAILNSLQMGFRTLAIEKRSSEVWTTLAAVKTEFSKFGDVLAKVKKKIDAASSDFGQVERRTRVISRKLSEVEALPEGQAIERLGEDRIHIVDDEEGGA